MKSDAPASGQPKSRPSEMPAIDAFRLVAAILVVAIHTSPLLGWSEAADFTLTRIIGRVAVPFFFMVSGYFLFAKAPLGQLPSTSLYRFLKKTAVLYGLAIAAYLPINLYNGTWESWRHLDALMQDLIFDGTLYHLWYLPASMLGAIIVYLLLRYLGAAGAMFAVSLLYLFALFGDSYYGWSEQIPVLSSMYTTVFSYFDYTRNGLFMAPIFLLLGGLLSTFRQRKWLQSKPFIVSALILSMMAMLGEGWLLHSLDWQRHDSMYVLLPIVMFFLFAWLLLYPATETIHTRQYKQRLSTYRSWRSLALLIYLIHPAVIVGVRVIAKATHTTTLFIDHALLHFLTVTTLSALLSMGLLRLPKVWPNLNSAYHYIQETLGKTHTHLQILPKQRRKKVSIALRSAMQRAWIEINPIHLRHNAAVLQAALPAGCRVMVVIKANAYGHGASFVANCLQETGIRSFAVADLTEGLALRASGISGEILVLGYTPAECAGDAAMSRLTLTAVDAEHAEALAQAGVPLRIHLKIDTGMHRLGEHAEQFDRIASVFSYQQLTVTGLYTHLQASACNNEASRAQTALQLQRFAQVRKELERHNITVPPWHTHSSYGLLHHQAQLDGSTYTRVGIALYGAWSTPHEHVETYDLRPVLSLRSRVALVKTVAPGTSIGYGLDEVAPKAMRIALLPIGYADGIPRSLSNGRGKVLLHGHITPIIGSVCMDQLTIDISNHPDVKPGDIATLIGEDGQASLTAEQLAADAGTITNELLSRLGPRLARIYTSHDKDRLD